MSEGLVVVVFQGAGDRAKTVSELFEAMVSASRNDVVLTFDDTATPGATTSPVTANVRVTLDTSDPENWSLRLEKGDRVLQRELGSGPTRDEAIVEAAAVVAAQAVLALLDAPDAPLPEWSSPVESDAEPPPAPTRPPHAEPTPEPVAGHSAAAPSWGLFVGAGYELAMLAPSALADHGFGGILGVEWPGGTWLALRAARHPWLSVDSSSGRFELERTLLAATLGVHSNGEPLRVGASLGGLAEVRERPRGSAENFVAATPGQTTLHYGITARALLGVRVLPALELSLGLGADVVAPKRRYSTPDQALLVPYLVRPEASLTLVYHFGF